MGQVCDKRCIRDVPLLYILNACICAFIVAKVGILQHYCSRSWCVFVKVFLKSTASSYLHRYIMLHIHGSSCDYTRTYEVTKRYTVVEILKSIYKKALSYSPYYHQRQNLKEHHPTLTTLITLWRILHRIGRRSRSIRNRATVSKEQDLNRDGQTGVQSDDDNEENAGGFCVDGGDDGVPVFRVSFMIW